MKSQIWNFGKAIRPVFADPVTYTTCKAYDKNVEMILIRKYIVKIKIMVPSYTTVAPVCQDSKMKNWASIRPIILWQLKAA